MRRYQTFRRLPVSLPHQLVQGCKLWLAADQIKDVANGAKVSVWTDIGPFSNSAIQATDANRPTFLSPAIYNYPAINFADSGTYLSLSNLVLTNFTIFAVYNLLAITRVIHYLLGGSGVGLHAGGSFAGVDGWGFYDGSIQVNANQEPTQVWNIMTWQNNKLFRNGVEATYTSSGTSTGMTLNIVGRRETSWADGYFNGYLAELIVFDVLLHSYDRKFIERYLAEKYAQIIAPT